MFTKKRIIFWLIPTLLLVLGLVQLFRPQAVPVDLIDITQGPFVVTIDEEGITRVRDTFTVSAPITGVMRRTLLEVGDSVEQGVTIVAQIEPIDPDFLDARSQADAEAAVETAKAALQLSKADVDKARAELDFARTEAERARHLYAQQLASKQSIDDAERTFRIRQAALAAANASRSARLSELLRAKAKLITPAQTQGQRGECACVDIAAPVSGSVLQIFHESEGVVQAGSALIEIGDSTDLEISTDLLSTDAVKVSAGQRVIIDNWGGDESLQGVVRRVEPFGFTKVSALGIEEQRVKVIIDFIGPALNRANLGHGYRVEPRIVIWESDNVLSIPVTALFRDSDNWAVFVDNNGQAEKREIKIGQRSGLYTHIVTGLEVSDRVVLHPGSRVDEGVPLVAR